MRALALPALALVLAACGSVSDDGAQCTIDADCTCGDICSRAEECWPPDQIHAVTIHWTIGGQAPIATTCAGITSLDVDYDDSQSGRRVGFSPVACNEGQFPIDKWPVHFDTAMVTAHGNGNQTQGTAPIPRDPSADVTVDVAHP